VAPDAGGWWRLLAGGDFADLAPERRRAVAATFNQQGGARLFALNRVVLLGD